MVQVRRPSEDPAMPSTGPYHSFMASLHVAMGIGEGVGGIHLSGVNNLVDPQRGSSQSWIGHPLRVPQQSGEGAGAAFPGCINSQTAMRVPRTTPESAPGACNAIGGSGKPLFRTPPGALGVAMVGSAAVASGGASTARALREGVGAGQGQSGSKAGAPAVAGGSRPVQRGQGGFAGLSTGDELLSSYSYDAESRVWDESVQSLSQPSVAIRPAVQPKLVLDGRCCEGIQPWCRSHSGRRLCRSSRRCERTRGQRRAIVRNLAVPGLG